MDTLTLTPTREGERNSEISKEKKDQGRNSANTIEQDQEDGRGGGPHKEQIKRFIHKEVTYVTPDRALMQSISQKNTTDN